MTYYTIDIKDYSLNPLQISSLIERRVNWGQLSTGGHKALSILNVLYQDKGDWYMKRKFNKYISYLRGETETLKL